MAIIVDNQPKNFELSRNPIVFELRTNNLIQTGGVASHHKLEFVGLPPNGDTWNMKWLNNAIDLDFSVADTPDNSGRQVTTGSGGIVDYIANVFIPELKQNFYLNRDFDIWQSGTTVYFTAWVKSPDYDITYTSGAQTWNNGFIQINAGALEVERPDFKIGIEVFTRNKGVGDYTRRFRERSPIDNEVPFDISALLRDYDQVILPAIPISSIQDVSAQLCEYYIRYGEIFGDPRLAQIFEQSSIKYASFGGLSERDRDGHSVNDDHLPNFLTYRTAQDIYTEQPSYLHFFNSTGFTAFDVMIDLYQDGQVIDSRIAFNLNAAANTLKMIPSDYATAINGVTLNGALPDYYEIYLYQDGTTTQVGNTIGFNVIRKSQLDQVYVAYQNSFGVLETFPFIGISENRASIQSNFAKTLPAYNDAYTNKSDVIYQLDINDQLVLRSGYMSKANIRLLQDLVASRRIYLIADDFIPIRISESQELTKAVSQKNTLYSLELTAQLITEENSSNVKGSII